MKENHSQNMTEENLDRLARAVLQSAVLSDEEIEEIIVAPRLWQATRNRLAVEKERRGTSRFFGWRWQWASVAAFAILIAAGAAFCHFRQTNSEIAGDTSEKISDAPTVLSKNEPATFESKSKSSNQIISPNESPKISSIIKDRRITSQAKTIRARSIPTAGFAALNAAKIKLVRQAGTPPEEKTRKKITTETATEFIALSYLPATESGQVVRVKVPRSMMVSLGVTTKTEKNSELVNAEVVLGDDGAARAIRFLSDE